MLPRILLIPFLSLLAWGQSPQTPPPAPRLKIALDAGHGGEDTGAKGSKGLLEKDAALAIVKELKASLGEAGFDVVLVRGDDTFIPLWDRARLANEAGADLFISIHLNAARARAAKGSEVYFLSLDRGDEDAAAVAALENAGAEARPAADANAVVAGILEDMAQKAYLQDSERLAVAVQLQLNRLGGIKERGVKQAPFVVLRGAAMPAVLVESAFISNGKEEARLKDKIFLKKLAATLTSGIRRYFAGAAGTARRRAIATSK
ncbi:MAG: N-acetylmuramoyl-L-alanine amidase [Holophagaceae bacterium]|nr:N-acetylmuramoyl-L-alanine amidase [Holophagaceae bacterium]